MNRRNVSFGVLLAALVACEIKPPRQAVWITIPPDAPVEAVAESLTVHGIVSSAGAFARFARMGRRHRGIRPGTYPLQPDTPIGRVLVLLRRGTPPVVTVRVPAGIMVSELIPLLADRLGRSEASLAEAIRDPALRAAVGARSGSLEGYLYPTTYRFPTRAPTGEIVRMMVDTFEVRWRPEWDRELTRLGLTRDELVTLASIVQGEAPHPDDRHQVAAVYRNRLSRGMRLQADPTVVYALAQRRRLLYRDYAVESRYNTYTVGGLPPGPIGQPSVEAIEAALHPAATDDLYLVAQPDGRHVFSTTYRDHLAATRRIRAGGGVRTGAGRPRSSSGR